MTFSLYTRSSFRNHVRISVISMHYCSLYRRDVHVACPCRLLVVCTSLSIALAHQLEFTHSRRYAVPIVQDIYIQGKPPLRSLDMSLRHLWPSIASSANDYAISSLFICEERTSGCWRDVQPFCSGMQHLSSTSICQSSNCDSSVIRRLPLSTTIR